MTEPTPPNPGPSDPFRQGTDLQDAKFITNAVYALQAAAFVVGITYVIAVVVNYVKIDDLRGTLYESHFRWQIRTFWFSVLWSVLGFLTVIVGVGFVILFATWVWVIYRIVKGWLRLSEGKAMYV